MGKQKQKITARRPDEDGSDKPDFAADLFRGPDKPKKQAKSDSNQKAETEVTVGDRLDKSAMERLTKLKEAMAAQAAPAAAQSNQAQPGQRMVRGKGVAVRPQGKPSEDSDAERELSFSELFDPEPEDDKDFEDMLKGSKLDWRAFK